MKQWARRLLGVAAWLAASAQAGPGMMTDAALGAPDPMKDWYTLATPHFNIHYEEDQRVFAERLAGIAERVHVTLTPRVAYFPQGKTEIVINDSVDMSNGAATVLPYRQFFIYMAPPSSGELLDDADWVEMVFTHEYTHILHMDQGAGFPGGVRKVLGRWFFTFPQVFNPSWVSEGYAVWAETDAGKGIGRGQSALYDGMMRAEVLHGLRDLSGLSFHGYIGTDWPYGQSYLYGLYFFQFIEDTWGKDKVTAFIAAWNRNIIPFRMDARARQVFGMNATALHARFMAYLKQRFEPDIRAWKAQHPASVLSGQGYQLPGQGYRDQVKLDGSGGVYYYENNGRTAPAILHRTAGGAVETVAETRALQQFDVHPTAGVVMSGLQICNNTEAHADLFRLEEGHWRALTDCGRYTGGYWSPRGDRIAAIALDSGKQRVDLLDADGQRLETLYEAPLGETLGELSWHPQAAEIVVARKPQGQRWGLYRLTLASREWQPVALQSHPSADGMMHAPHYDAEGNTLYFIDAEAQRLNVRRLQLATGQVQTVTQTLTAITDFDINAGQLATLEYTAEGIALNVAERPVTGIDYVSRKAASLPAPFEAPSSEAPSSEVPSSGEAPRLAAATPYDPLPTLAPTSWLALLGADSEDNGWVQLMTSGSDVLGFHAWQLAPRLYYDQETLGGDASYVFHKRLAVLGTRLVTTEDEATETVPALLEVEDRAQLVWMQPINDIDAAWQLNVGIAKERARYEQEDVTLAARYVANLAGAALWVDSTDYYRYSISPENGRRVKLTAEKYDALGGGFFRGESYALDWNEYVTTWNNQVLALRWVEARADDEARTLELGGFHDTYETLASMIGFGKTSYALRGYDTGLDALAGDNLRLQSLEYRLPLANVFDGFMAPPVGLGKISAALFYDRGAAWNDQAERHYYAGAGAELSTDVLLGFDLATLDITVGAAQGLDDELGTGEVYVRLGAAF